MSDRPITVTGIIQARLNSTRLPGKVLMDLGGESVLARVVRRVRRARTITNCLVATTTSPPDDAIVRECEVLGIESFRGSEHDVLDRYYQAARQASCDAIVRITSDCPLVDPAITDMTIQEFLDIGPDYASNTLVRTYPRGLDTEVVGFEALSRCWQKASRPYQRSHVTAYIYEHPESFRLHAVRGKHDYSSHRWTVDTPEDLEFVRAVYAHFNGRDDFGWRDVLDLLQRQPELTALNRHVLQKALDQG